MANTYTTYKDSGIPWIGEIPKEWNYQRLRFLCEINTGNQDTQNKEENGKYPFYVRSPHIERCNNYTFKGESILMAGDGAGAGRVFHHAFGKYAVHQRVYMLYNIHNINTSFLFYYISNLFADVMDAGSAQSTVPSVRLPMLSNFCVCIPTTKEQESIVNFLDEKCSEIDDLISLQEKMIDELKEYKQSVITEAVTKGLDRKVKMKDSGVATIGEIPNHWKLVHFSKVNYIRARLGWKGLKAEEYVEQGHPFLSAFNIINDKLDWNDLNFINDIRYEESPEIKLSTNDLVLVKDGAGIGKCAVVESLPFGTATVNSSLAVITPLNYVNSKYQYYCLKSEAFQTIIWQLKIGMGVPHLTQENMKAIINPCPPIEEQEQIASYLDTKCSQIDSLISIKEKKIEELKDYKKSLIYEYVTGKKRV